MTEWLYINPSDFKACCAVSLGRRKKKELAKDGDTKQCPECQRTWVREGENLRLSPADTLPPT